MTDQTKTRTLFYRRAAWVPSCQQNLQKLLADAHSLLISTQDRTFQYGVAEIQGLAVKATDEGLFIHVATYIPDQPTSIVPYPSDLGSSNSSPRNPPSEHNYMDGDIFFIVNANHIVICPSNTRESIAVGYINHVLRSTGKEELIPHFSIEPVANYDKLEMLRKEGVKKISMNSSVYDATLDYVERKTAKHAIVGGAVEKLVSMFAEDDDQELRQLGELENLSVKVEFSFNSRKKGGEIGRKRIEKAATKILHDDDAGFTITTMQDNRVTSENVRVSSKVKLPAHGNSVWREDAKEALMLYIRQLRESGTLEQ